MIFDIPYKSSDIENKSIFDIFTTINKQVNNVNIASDVDDILITQPSHVFLIFYKRDVYIYSQLSSLDNKQHKFHKLVSFLSKLKGVSSVYGDLDFRCYTFDIDQFNSMLSFATDYRDRDIVKFLITDTEIKFNVSGTEITVGLLLPANSKLRSYIQDDFLKTCNCNTDINDSPDFYVNNIGKSLNLLPFFNYKDCMNFTVANTDTGFVIYRQQDGKLYAENIGIFTGDEGKIKLNYMAETYLREDNFFLREDKDKLSLCPCIWQILNVISPLKNWLTFKVYGDNFASIDLKQNSIFCSFSRKDFLSDDVIYSLDFEQKTSNYYLVGELHSNELYKINKLYNNACKNSSYFDFVYQEFLGCNYVFSKDKNEVVVTKFEKPIENTELPLRLSFVELKHYIGSDLSQKNYTLKIYTNGINVLLEKYNHKLGLIDNTVVFNHCNSKTYLNLL